MSIVEQLVGAMVNQTIRNSGGPVLNLIMSMIGNQQAGGFNGLIQNLSANGLERQVASWIGLGPNQPVTPQQVQQAMGPQQIAQMAQQAGLPQDQLLTTLASLLPGLVNHLTPQGQVPPPSALNQILASLQNQANRP